MGYKLLLADDSITIQKVVELVLAPEDFQIRSFNDGEQALSELPSFMPHIVLADIDMPKLNGYQLCEKIKNNPSTENIPVILLAGAFEPFDEEYAKRSGADDFIIKPFESQELISKVKALVKDLPLDNQMVESKEETQEANSEDDPFAALDAMPVLAEQAAEEEASSSEITFNPDDFVALQDTESEAPQDETDVPMSFEDTFTEALQKRETEAVQITEPINIDASIMPSKEEVLELFKQAIDDKLVLFLDDEFKEALRGIVKERLEGIVKETVPLITEQVARDILHGIGEETRDNVVAVLNRVVPETTKSLVEKEINRITSELPY